MNGDDDALAKALMPSMMVINLSMYTIHCWSSLGSYNIKVKNSCCSSSSFARGGRRSRGGKVMRSEQGKIILYCEKNLTYPYIPFVTRLIRVCGQVRREKASREKRKTQRRVREGVTRWDRCKNVKNVNM